VTNEERGRSVDYESTPLTRAEYISAIVHLYRGEMHRATVWRVRLDTTTNWSVLTTAGLLAFVFRDSANPHWPLLIGMLLIGLLMAYEARRYQVFDVWRARVRKIEENFYGPILKRDPISPQTGWGGYVAQDLLAPVYKISFRGALRARRKDFQMIFQDPFSSMDPRMMVGEVVMEGLRAQAVGKGTEERRARAAEMLRQVGLEADVMDRYPHEFSGGQRQRICIARALAVDPKLLVCDEPTSALDVSVQAQVLNLMRRLQAELALSYLFITHDMSVVGYMADEVAVMYLGRVVEQGSVRDVLERPAHPYTQALLAAAPTVEQSPRRPVIRLQGDPPSPASPPRGCHFRARCPHAMARCGETYPGVTPLGSGHRVRCFLHGG